MSVDDFWKALMADWQDFENLHIICCIKFCSNKFSMSLLIKHNGLPRGQYITLVPQGGPIYMVHSWAGHQPWPLEVLQEDCWIRDHRLFAGRAGKTKVTPKQKSSIIIMKKLRHLNINQRYSFQSSFEKKCSYVLKKMLKIRTLEILL